MNSIKNEIERKWLIKTISPALFALLEDAWEVNYAFLNGWRYAEIFYHNPEKHNGAQRHFCKVRKAGQGLNKVEETVDISPEEFIAAWENEESKILTKIRNIFQKDGFTYEIDIYNEIQLATLEVEFSSVAEAEKFVIHEKAPKALLNQLLLEVTQFPQFSNASLAISQEVEA